MAYMDDGRITRTESKQPTRLQSPFVSVRAHLNA
jgi:hypothetical protein